MPLVALTETLRKMAEWRFGLTKYIGMSSLMAIGNNIASENTATGVACPVSQLQGAERDDHL